MKQKWWTLALIGLVCGGPFVLALAFYYGPWGNRWLPQLDGSRELLAEPVLLPESWRAAAARPWQLIYARAGACELPCAHDLGRLLQVQLALGADQEYVERVVWHEGELPSLEDPGLLAQSLADDNGRAAVAALGGAEALAAGRVLVADARGYAILSYPPDVEQKELLRDLKRLVRGTPR